MVEPGLLIGIFAVIFFVTWRYIWKRDVLFGAVYFFLFVYTIFTQIGYAYFPEISKSIKAYFGPEIFYRLNIFITLSFLVFFLLFLLLHKYVVKGSAYNVVYSKPRLSIFFYLAVLFHLLLMALYLIKNYDVISYISMSDESVQANMGLEFILFGVGFKLSVAIILILYFLYRVRIHYAPRVNRRAALAFLFFELLLFALITIKTGNRTDPLALTIAILVLEVLLVRAHIYRTGKWKWLKILFVIIVILFGLVKIEAARNPGVSDARPVAEIVLQKDYFAPSHMLIAAMAYDFVEPWDVIISNSSNMLVLLKQPYLQTSVTDLFNPGVSSRSTGYAFYIFSEGYIFMGLFGCLYNGIVVFAGLAIWRRLANSSNNYYNLFMLSLVATQAVNVVRGQSSYFVKDIYMFFVPAMVLFFLATGLRPWFGRLNCTLDSVLPQKLHQPEC